MRNERLNGLADLELRGLAALPVDAVSAKPAPDPRFEDPFYRRLLPPDWEARRPPDERALAAMLEHFWRCAD